jgi:hypothetical protein
MSTLTTSSSLHRDAQLLRHTVVVIGGSAGIGLETRETSARCSANSGCPRDSIHRRLRPIANV